MGQIFYTDRNIFTWYIKKVKHSLINIKKIMKTYFSFMHKTRDICTQKIWDTCRTLINLQTLEHIFVIGKKKKNMDILEKTRDK